MFPNVIKENLFSQWACSPVQGYLDKGTGRGRQVRWRPWVNNGFGFDLFESKPPDFIKFWTASFNCDYVQFSILNIWNVYLTKLSQFGRYLDGISSPLSRTRLDVSLPVSICDLLVISGTLAAFITALESSLPWLTAVITIWMINMT